MTWPASRFVVVQDRGERGFSVLDSGSATSREARERRVVSYESAGVPKTLVCELVPVEAMDRIRAFIAGYGTNPDKEPIYQTQTESDVRLWHDLPDEVKP